MIMLSLNGTKAVLANGTSIRLTRDNPYYTDSGDYTLEVSLPLRGCPQNSLIFGAITHPAVPLVPTAHREFSFTLQAPGLNLSGKAVPTAVSDSEVKLQLLAGRSALNFDFLGESGERYINELPLGYAYEELWRRAQTGTSVPTQQGLAALLYSSFVTPQEADRLMHGTCDETDCLLYPIYSEADGQFANRHDYSYYIYTTDTILPDGSSHPRWQWHTEEYHLAIDAGKRLVQGLHAWDPVALRAKPIPFAADLVLAPQPYLCFIVERILQALGYELSASDNALRSDPVLRTLFVANARGSLRLADGLPHWTVREFFDELRKTYGVRLQAEGSRVMLRRRTDWVSEVRFIQWAGDVRTADIDLDDDTHDTTAGNVAYDFSDTIDRQLSIGEDSYEQMTVVRTTTAELANEFNKLDEQQADESNHLYLCTDTGQRYGILPDDQGRPVLREVDYMGPIIRDQDTAIDHLLRIVPVSMSAEFPTRRCRYEFRGNLPAMPPKDHLYTLAEAFPTKPQEAQGDRSTYVIVPYMVTADTRERQRLSPFSLSDYIAEDSATADTTAEKPDRLEVATNYGDGVIPYAFRPNGVTNLPDGIYERSFSYPIGVHWVRDTDGKRALRPITPSRFFVLHKPGTMANQALQPDRGKVDTRVLHQIDIYDPSVTDPTATYLINGRRYACQRLELTLQGHGVLLPVRGYFYELDA